MVGWCGSQVCGFGWLTGQCPLVGFSVISVQQQQHDDYGTDSVVATAAAGAAVTGEVTVSGSAMETELVSQ